MKHHRGVRSRKSFFKNKFIRSVAILEIILVINPVGALAGVSGYFNPPASPVPGDISDEGISWGVPPEKSCGEICDGIDSENEIAILRCGEEVSDRGVIVTDDDGKKIKFRSWEDCKRWAVSKAANQTLRCTAYELHEDAEEANRKAIAIWKTMLGLCSAACAAGLAYAATMATPWGPAFDKVAAATGMICGGGNAVGIAADLALSGDLVTKSNNEVNDIEMMHDETISIPAGMGGAAALAALGPQAYVLLSKFKGDASMAASGGVDAAGGNAAAAGSGPVKGAANTSKFARLKYSGSCIAMALDAVILKLKQTSQANEEAIRDRECNNVKELMPKGSIYNASYKCTSPQWKWWKKPSWQGLALELAALGMTNLATAGPTRKVPARLSLTYSEGGQIYSHMNNAFVRSFASQVERSFPGPALDVLSPKEKAYLQSMPNIDQAPALLREMGTSFEEILKTPPQMSGSEMVAALIPGVPPEILGALQEAEENGARLARSNPARLQPDRKAIAAARAPGSISVPVVASRSAMTQDDSSQFGSLGPARLLGPSGGIHADGGLSIFQIVSNKLEGVRNRVQAYEWNAPEKGKKRRYR